MLLTSLDYKSLEHRIRELDEENDYFRKLLNFPPANRSPLGKGPTGRGIAKSRSRLNLDGSDRQCGSPEPPSEASSTPPMEYAMSIPATTMEVHPPLVGSGESISLHMGSDLDSKMGNGYSSRGIYGDAMLAEPNMHCDVDGPGPILPFGYHGEAPWPVTPDVPLSAEMTPTMETARYYTFPPSAEPVQVHQAHQQVMPQPVQGRPMAYGHRRSHTEPQSFGSVAPPFSPSHRSCNSQSFVPVVGHELTPSPPPLSIRSNVQGFR
jgi:hypothetical protein